MPSMSAVIYRSTNVGLTRINFRAGININACSWASPNQFLESNQILIAVLLKWTTMHGDIEDRRDLLGFPDRLFANKEA